MMTVDVKFQRITIVRHQSRLGVELKCLGHFFQHGYPIILVLFHRFQVLSILRTCAFIVDTFMFVGIK